MNIDELKASWQNINIRVEKLENENRRTAQALACGRIKSAQERLARQYRLNAWQGLLLPVIAPLVVYVLDMPYWVAAVYALFGAVMAAIMFIRADKLSGCDLISLPVVEALAQAVALRKNQNRIMLAGIVFGCALLAIMLFYILNIYDNSAILLGFICGIAVGLPIGIRKQLKQRRLIRQIENAIREVS